MFGNGPTPTKILTGQSRPDDQFSVAYVGRLKHGAISEGLARRGWSQSDLARALNSKPTFVGKIINMQYVPGKKWLTLDRQRVFFELTNQLPEDLWPEWYSQNRRWLRADKRVRVIRDVPVRLLMQGLVPKSAMQLVAHDDPEQERFVQECRDAIMAALHALTPREEQVIRLKFGFDGDGEKSVRDIANIMHRSPECVRQLEAKALKKLRNPNRSYSAPLRACNGPKQNWKDLRKEGFYFDTKPTMIVTSAPCIEPRYYPQPSTPSLAVPQADTPPPAAFHPPRVIGHQPQRGFGYYLIRDASIHREIARGDPPLLCRALRAAQALQRGVAPDPEDYKALTVHLQ